MNYSTVGGLTTDYEGLKEKLLLLKNHMKDDILYADSADWSKATKLIDALNEEIDLQKEEIKKKAEEMKNIASEFGSI